MSRSEIPPAPTDIDAVPGADKLVVQYEKTPAGIGRSDSWLDARGNELRRDYTLVVARGVSCEVLAGLSKVTEG